jgi:chromosome segregation ATPase
MFGMNQNHEVRIHALEEKVNHLMERELDQNELLVQLDELSQKYDSLAELQHQTDRKRMVQADSIQELRHELNASNKRISQLFDVIGVLMEENKNNLSKFNNIVSNLDTAYAIVDQRLSNLGFAVGKHEQEIATLVDFKNALSTTGIVVKVADVAAEVKVKYRVG